MPLAHAVFFAKPREFTQAQIDELRVAGLLREDAPAPPKPAPPVPPPPAPAPAAKPEETK